MSAADTLSGLMLEGGVQVLVDGTPAEIVGLIEAAEEEGSTFVEFPNPDSDQPLYFNRRVIHVVSPVVPAQKPSGIDAITGPVDDRSLRRVS